MTWIRDRDNKVGFELSKDKEEVLRKGIKRRLGGYPGMTKS